MDSLTKSLILQTALLFNIIPNYSFSYTLNPRSFISSTTPYPQNVTVALNNSQNENINNRFSYRALNNNIPSFQAQYQQADLNNQQLIRQLFPTQEPTRYQPLSQIQNKQNQQSQNSGNELYQNDRSNLSQNQPTSNFDNSQSYQILSQNQNNQYQRPQNVERDYVQYTRSNQGQDQNRPFWRTDNTQSYQTLPEIQSRQTQEGDNQQNIMNEQEQEMVEEQQEVAQEQQEMTQESWNIAQERKEPATKQPKVDEQAQKIIPEETQNNNTEIQQQEFTRGLYLQGLLQNLRNRGYGLPSNKDSSNQVKNQSETNYENVTENLNPKDISEQKDTASNYRANGTAQIGYSNVKNSNDKVYDNTFQVRGTTALNKNYQPSSTTEAFSSIVNYPRSTTRPTLAESVENNDDEDLNETKIFDNEYSEKLTSNKNESDTYNSNFDVTTNSSEETKEYSQELVDIFNQTSTPLTIDQYDIIENLQHQSTEGNNTDFAYEYSSSSENSSSNNNSSEENVQYTITTTSPVFKHDDLNTAVEIDSSDSSEEDGSYENYRTTFTENYMPTQNSETTTFSAKHKTPEVYTQETSTLKTTTTESPNTTPIFNKEIIPNLCEDCQFIHGAGYNPHPTDCSLFVQCRQDHLGRPEVAAVQSCPHGLYWNQHKLTCDHKNNVNCQDDICQQNSSLKTKPSRSNCNGFWDCSSGVAQARCCAAGFAFNPVLQQCTYQPSCQDYCLKNAKSSPPKMFTCNGMRSVPEDPSKYEVKTGSTWTRMPCPPTLAFSQGSCGCTTPLKNIPETLPKEHSCSPEIYLPFDHSAKDYSENKFYVRNEGVRVKHGKAFFDGTNRLIIPRFSHAWWGKTVHVQMRVKPLSTTVPGGKLQALVSNGDCDDHASLSMCLGSSRVEMTAHTTQNSAAYNLTVPVSDQQRYQNSNWLDVLYKIDHDTFSGFVGTTSKQVPIKGVLETRPKGLIIGSGGGCDNFFGFIDEITVFLCSPYIN